MTPRDRPIRAHARPIGRSQHSRRAPVREETDAYDVVRPRRRRSLKRTLTILLVLSLAAIVVVGALFWSRLSAFNDAVSTAPSVSSALLLPLNGSDRVNVLMLGYGGIDHDGQYLADSINILSINPKADATTIIPIPRDLWIEGLPQLPDNGKVNEIFPVGFFQGGVAEGARATAEVLTEVTGLRIDHWMAIDFDGFREMVDAVGGVTVENPTAFSYTWYEEAFQAGTFEAGSFASGTLELNGEEALDYARTRYASVPEEASDFARSVRQQRIMVALKSKLGAGGISSIGPGLQVMDALANRLETDLSAIDLYLLSSHITADRRVELSEDVILEAAFSSVGQYVLVVVGRASSSDYAPLHAYLAEALAEPMEPASSPGASAVGS